MSRMLTDRLRRLCGLCLLSALAPAAVLAQSTLPAAGTPKPFWNAPRPGLPSASATPAPLSTATQSSLLPDRSSGAAASPFGQQAANPPPPTEIPLIEKKYEELSNHDLSEDGKKALAMDPAKWKHAETDNFIIHFRRATEAKKVAEQVEYDLWYVATQLGASKDRYRKKSHVYVFLDEKEWKEFLETSNNKMKWAASYAYGDELYLNVHGGGNSGSGTSFDAQTLAHETTHAVVARLYPHKRWPLWLNEGLAEFMGKTSVAARKSQFSKRFERALNEAELPLEKLEAMRDYPEDPIAIAQLYQSSEKFVRFLMNEGGKERFPKFIDAILAGQSMQDSVHQIYDDKFKDWDTLEKRYAKFTK